MQDIGALARLATKLLTEQLCDIGLVIGMLTLMRCTLGLTVPRQSDREFGELIGHAVDLDRAAVLLHDDVVGD